MNEDEERTALCERILLDLNNIFKKDDNLEEFDIIEINEPARNKSPVVYVDHNLGLEKWCVSHLYAYAHKRFVDYKLNKIHRPEYDLLHQWTRILLLINPDFTTAWNVRRDLVCKCQLSMENELSLSQLILSRKPKCASVFSYREFLLNFELKRDGQLSDGTIENELRISLKAADRYRRNYYAWSHRTRLFTVYLQRSSSDCDFVINKMLEDLVRTQEWLECRISEYSGFVHRQCLHAQLHQLVQTSTTQLSPKVKQTFLSEFEWMETLVPLYFEHESLFLHRRYMLHAAKLWHPQELQTLHQMEMSFHSQYLCQSKMPWVNTLVTNYLNYLERHLGWKFGV